MAEIQTLTTGQAARYCHVSQATILNWIKKGKLEAYATPGGHYRILLPDFLSFLEMYKMPVDSELRVSRTCTQTEQGERATRDTVHEEHHDGR
jgi:excisionase family DNA binding protein